MTIDTQASLVGCLDLAVAIVLPFVLFLFSARWRLFFRLALSVLLPWLLLFLVRGFIGQPVEEAYYYAHPPDPNDWEADAAGYDQVGGNVAVLFFGWLYPLLVCLLTATVTFVVRRVYRRFHPKPQTA